MPRSICRQRRDASTSSREDTRPCYGGDARNHIGLEFKLTADDAQRALRKWAKCVARRHPRSRGAHKSSSSDARRNLPGLTPALPFLTSDAARNPFGRGRSWTATDASPRFVRSSSRTGSSTSRYRSSTAARLASTRARRRSGSRWTRGATGARRRTIRPVPRCRCARASRTGATSPPRSPERTWAGYPRRERLAKAKAKTKTKTKTKTARATRG